MENPGAAPGFSLPSATGIAIGGSLPPTRQNETEDKRHRERTQRRFTREAAELIWHATGPAAILDGARNAFGGGLHGLRGVVHRLSRLVEYGSAIVGHLELRAYAVTSRPCGCRQFRDVNRLRPPPPS